MISNQNGSIVDIRDRNIKFNNKEDVKEISQEFSGKSNVTTLKLSGNTFGIPACEELGSILEHHSSVTTCHFNDIFTSRLKTEIAPSLEHISQGLTLANVRLVELDLSDNAFGPNGVVGITRFISSVCCSTLKYLKMNNQGLGIGGSKLLADAIDEGLNTSNDKGLRLKLFWAARNRLENEGIENLAPVISRIGTIEDLALYQNSIGVKGLDGPKSLAMIVKNNPHLEHINFSDNSIKPLGIEHLVRVLKKLRNLRSLELDDCLLHNEGAKCLAKFLDDPEHVPNLEKLRLEGNEIGRIVGVKVALSLSGKSKINHISLNSNEFGYFGVNSVMQALDSIKLLGSLHKPDDFEPEAPIDDDWEEIRQYAFNEDTGPDDEEEEDEEEFSDEDYDEEEEPEEYSNESLEEKEVESFGGFNFKDLEQSLIDKKGTNNSLFSNIPKTDSPMSNMFKASPNKNAPLFEPSKFHSTIGQLPSAETLKSLLLNACREVQSFQKTSIDKLSDILIQHKKILEKPFIRDCSSECVPEHLAHAGLHLLEKGPFTDPMYQDILQQSCVNVLSVLLTNNEFSKDNPMYTNASRAANAVLVHVGAIKPEVGDTEMKKMVQAAEPFLKAHIKALRAVSENLSTDSHFSNSIKLSLISVLGKTRPKLNTLTAELDKSLEDIVNSFQKKVNVSE
ncbi:Ran GTPase-activating protein 1 [Cichlidogyrus casuarinus]|uniref:Ran GTPase-activating protein 1 n=1 Tax=Cichlidogyrus casuarinus TaxID=1844966 RepID=A0ABD2QN06_9PLAT